jgi:molybdopterin-guanine dinucleotide biosynthesis protein A
MRTTHLLALAVDMPFITSEQLRRLWDLAQKGEGVVPVIRDRAEPLAAIYPAEAAADFAAGLAGTDFSLQAIIRKLASDEKVRLVPISAEDEHLYRSVNEPSDLKEGRFPNRPPKNVGPAAAG